MPTDHEHPNIECEFSKVNFEQLCLSKDYLSACTGDKLEVSLEYKQMLHTFFLGRLPMGRPNAQLPSRNNKMGRQASDLQRTIRRKKFSMSERT